MAHNKITHTFDLRNDQLDWLDQIVEEYGLPDEEKALRILLDYAIQDGDKDLIFSDENMRCRYCG
jgi:hypothetical protein